MIYADDNTYYFHRNRSYYNDILDNGLEEHYLKVVKDDVICLDCPEDYKVSIDVKDDNSKLKIDDDGLEIKTDDKSLEINNDGLKAENENVKVIIDDEGIEVQSNEDGN